MAAYDYTRAPAASSVFAGRLGAQIVNVFGTIVAWNDARQTRKQLGVLTDRELEDIGLCRGDIDGVVAPAFRR
ncbi:DUF1127 domain-containing protein [Roseobacteraceae bacterium S113]